MLEMIMGTSPYKSPTDMGVNMAGNCIIDDEACREASLQEIIRRYYKALYDKRITGTAKDDIRKLELLMNQADISIEDRLVVGAALEKEKNTGHPAVALELPDGTIVTGKTGDLLGPSAAMILNAIKVLADIDDEIKLIAPEYITPIQTLKTDYLGSSNPNLHMDEILIALSSSAGTNELAARALKQLPKLRGCDAHSTVILSAADSGTFRKLGIQLTCEPRFEEEDLLYHKL